MSYRNSLTQSAKVYPLSWHMSSCPQFDFDPPVIADVGCAQGSHVQLSQ